MISGNSVEVEQGNGGIEEVEMGEEEGADRAELEAKAVKNMGAAPSELVRGKLGDEFLKGVKRDGALCGLNEEESVDLDLGLGRVMNPGLDEGLDEAEEEIRVKDVINEEVEDNGEIEEGAGDEGPKEETKKMPTNPSHEFVGEQGV
ncbi:hypothetical protein MLD38_009322 [Melastoma candidum]|uniref:Uncharacterized protein n=1 Tax=Melastoma candidum TaxID=119954 RepID=A0ACB9RX52_9MYRT|nr:hypothetical protein MLD38_009322 [Melastoma candidum]